MADTCLSSSCSDYTSGPIGQLFTSSLQFLFAAQCMINENWPSDESNIVQDLTFDYIVVGAGSAGCVVASRLSEDSFRRVLLVEAGGDPPLESLVPSGSPFLYRNPEYAWQYQSENNSLICQQFPGGRCPIIAGKMLGGCSSINGMAYYRGNRQDYDDLEKAGNIGWNYDIALEYFKKSENLSDEFIRNNPRLSIYHNFDGLLGVRRVRRPVDDEINQVIIKGYMDAGYQYNLDQNGQYQMGVHRSFHTIQDGVRESTARAFLVPVRERPNLVVFKNSLVTKVLIENKVATGVQIQLQNGTIIECKALKEVILSAGAIRSPHLLMLSGIGPRSHLNAFNIPVVANLPVGKNLLDHVFFEIPVEVKCAPLTTPVAVDVANYLALRKGFFAITTLNILATAAFITTNISSHDNYLPNFQVVHFFEDRQVSFYLSYLDGLSRGEITLASSNPIDSPKINLNFFDDNRDIDYCLKAIDFVLDLIKTPSFKSIEAKYIPDPACACSKFLSKDYWKCVLFRNANSDLHYRGTAKMGPSTDKEAVVNPQLQVYGVKHLRVVDGSVIPGVIRSPINGPIIMLAERASDFIKETHKCDTS